MAFLDIAHTRIDCDLEDMWDDGEYEACGNCGEGRNL